MDVYTTEEQQIEEIKKWWKENGKSIIAGIVLGLAGIFGWRGWLTHQNTQMENAARYYKEMIVAAGREDQEKVKENAEKIFDEYQSSAYAVFAKLLLAKQAVNDKNYAEARGHLQWALKYNKDDSLEHEIRLRIVRVLIAQNNTDEALKLLDVKQKGAYSGSYDELRGDILTIKNDLAGAQAAYQQALTKARASGNDVRLLEAKLDNIGRNDT